MARFVLVAGARLGAWAWDEVADRLRAAGHDARPLTLSGLAEKRDTPAGQQTHVADIVNDVEHNDVAGGDQRDTVHDVILVGHSYAGIPVGQAAERIGDRLAHVVFVDSEVPVDGRSFLSAWPDGGAQMATLIADHGGYWPVPTADRFDGHGLTAAQIERIMRGSTPHPGATLLEPAVLRRPLGDLPATYVHCRLGGGELAADVAELVRGGRWRLRELDTGHWPMFSQPAELARILLDAAPAENIGAQPTR
jgi:pimeloyl-ACP methyl ester carboxylesterase